MTGNLKWEFQNNSPRTVKYLAYPANYGMVPMTMLSKGKVEVLGYSGREVVRNVLVQALDDYRRISRKFILGGKIGRG